MLELVYGVVVFLISAAGGLVGAFFGGYFRKKGENLATKEDVKQITDLAEEISSKYREDAARAGHERQMLIESFKAEQNLRTLVAADRFRAHQQAYAIWQQLVGWRYGDSTKLQEGYDWWRNNNLYLDEPARSAFHQALYYWSAKNITITKKTRESDALKKVRELDDAFMAVGKVIAECVGLPPLVEPQLFTEGDPKQAATSPDVQ